MTSLKDELKLLAKAWLGKSTRKLLGPNVCALLVQTETGVFAVDPEDNELGRQLRLRGSWGVDELHRLEPHLGVDTSVLIVGAHIGTLAIPIARKCRSVTAIEANPRTYRLLLQNIALNASVNCTPYNIAASDRREQLGFLLNRANSGGSKRTPKNRAFIYYYDRPEEISVRAESLDQFFDAARFDIVVMDIEGSEYFALKGMQRILADCRLLVVEFVPHHLTNVSGVGVAEFLSVIAPHFGRLTIPSQGKTVEAPEFLACLSQMHAAGQVDDGILFEKV